MQTCDNCGAPVHATWEFCPRCEADLRAQRAEPDAPRPSRREVLRSGSAGLLAGGQRLAGRVRSIATPPARTDGSAGASTEAEDRTHGWDDAPDGEDGDGRGEDRPMSGILGARAPAWTLVVALALTVLALFLGGALFGAEDSAEELRAARDAQDRAAAEAERLAAVVATAEATEAELRAALETAQRDLEAAQGTVAGSESELADAEAEVESLRQQVAAAESAIAERDASLEERQGQLATMAECLGGMEVALAFAMEGRVGSAERALETVASACDTARSFF